METPPALKYKAQSKNISEKLTKYAFESLHVAFKIPGKSQPAKCLCRSQ